MNGWIIGLAGEAVNLAHVRRVCIGSRFQEAKSHEDEAPDGAMRFHVEAEMHYLPRADWPVLAQNLETREAAEHWIASRFGDVPEPQADPATGADSVEHRSIKAVIDDVTLNPAELIAELQAMPGVKVRETVYGWLIDDPATGESWHLQRLVMRARRPSA
jgi:hypothetical protein